MNEREPLRFKNGRFTVLQVSDAQDLQFVRGTMMKMLSAAYDAVLPDLIVLTGDQVLGNHLRDCNYYTRLTVRSREGELRALRTALRKLLSPIEMRGIPFAMIFGNHDDMNLITKEEHAAIYREYSCCVGLNSSDPDVDCDTYDIPIYAEHENRTAYRLWMLDSAGYDKETRTSYHYVTENTVRWYARKSSEYAAANSGVLTPALMFLHIPIPETLRLIEECPKMKDAVCEDGRYYRLKPGVNGVMGEFPSVCQKQTGLFDAVKRCGDVRALVFGHDHMNSFTGKVDGVGFIQTGGASFRCYGSSAARSVRVFRLYEDGRFETNVLSYWQLCGKSPGSVLRYLWDADEMVKTKIGVLGGAAIGASAAIAGAVISNHKK